PGTDRCGRSSRSSWAASLTGRSSFPGPGSSPPVRRSVTASRKPCMPDNDLRGRLTRCFLSYFTNLSAAEVPRASMTSVGEWEWMASVTLIALVSEEFAIEVAPDDYERFVSFGLILDYLEGRQHVS